MKQIFEIEWSENKIEAGLIHDLLSDYIKQNHYDNRGKLVVREIKYSKSDVNTYYEATPEIHVKIKDDIPKCPECDAKGLGNFYGNIFYGDITKEQQLRKLIRNLRKKSEGDKR